MRKLRLISYVLAISLLAALTLAPSELTTVSAAKAEFNAVTEEFPDDNVLYLSDFDSVYSLDGVAAPSNWLTQVRTPTGCYLQLSGITVNYSGFTITNPKKSIPAGLYKFTGYFRMMYEDEVTALRLSFRDTEGGSTTLKVYPTSDKWMKVEYYVTLAAPFASIGVCGEAAADYIQPYCIDNFSLVPVSSIPSDFVNSTSFGKKVSAAEAASSQVDSIFPFPKWDEEFESRYEVQGVIVNQDANALIGGLAGSGGDAATFVNFAKGYAGSHVTDFMMCVCNMISTVPTDLPSWTDLIDKYYQTTENGVAVDYSNESHALGAYKHFKEKGIDYFDIWCKTFPTVGINPWISIRMNDIHGNTYETSPLLSDFYHENPQYRRVTHSNNAGTYSGFNKALDFYHEEVRERMLDYINDMLSRYDCYGLELDYQREIRLWHHGYEYQGLDTLSEFMHEVDRIIEIYEEKYGHEIKLGIRCGSDIETNYDFGLDILTWAAEGILDLVIPTGRWDSTDNEIPVREWTSLLHPYGVTVAPCIEVQLRGESRHTLETYNGAAAAYLSQGADKIALYNEYLAAAQYIRDKHRVFTEDESVGGTWRHWNIVSTIGSYEKLMTLNRRVILTYNDTYHVWRKSNSQIPQSVAAGETMTLRIPFGDVPIGGTVTLKFSADAPNDVFVPTVYINSKRATFIGSEAQAQGGYTTNRILCYSVPASAIDDMYVVAEITAENPLTVDYAEVYVKANG